METLVAQGKVVYVGASNFAGWHLAQACESARARRFLGLVSEQSLYNLLERTVELEVVPACQAYGLALLPWSPLRAGVLAGGATGRDSGRRASEVAREMLANHGEQLAAYEALCAERGLAPHAVALAWLLGRPAVTAPIVGPRTRAQLDEALGALSLRLEPDLAAKLDELFPGPGGPAPEAYAW
jgi:aryl-alcohol dehydrogenase-like predicted oxidoreductase